MSRNFQNFFKSTINQIQIDIWKNKSSQDFTLFSIFRTAHARFFWKTCVLACFCFHSKFDIVINQKLVKNRCAFKTSITQYENLSNSMLDFWGQESMLWAIYQVSKRRHYEQFCENQGKSRERLRDSIIWCCYFRSKTERRKVLWHDLKKLSHRF